MKSDALIGSWGLMPETTKQFKQYQPEPQSKESREAALSKAEAKRLRRLERNRSRS